jgi:hypothetical protein
MASERICRICGEATPAEPGATRDLQPPGNQGFILRGLEPEFTMRLPHIRALQELRKTVSELIRAQQIEGGARQDIDPGRTAGGMVVIVISLLMATMQTGADDGRYELVASEVESVLHAATRPST